MIRIILKEQNIRPTERDAEHFKSRESEKENELLTQNIQILKQMSPNLHRQIPESLYQHISPLKRNKITKRLGSGSYGVAFLLDNEHVLKIGNIRATEELQRVEKNEQNAFAGSRKFKRDDLHIFDYGEIMGRNEKLYWRETPKYIPLKDLMNPVELYEMTDFCLEVAQPDFLVKTTENGSLFILKFDDWLDLSLKYLRRFSEAKKFIKKVFDEKQLKNFLKLLYTEGVKYTNEYSADNLTAISDSENAGAGPDTHPGNIGIDDVSGAFVFFDF